MQRKGKIVLLVGTWAVLTVAVFWWYQFRVIQPFDPGNVLFDGVSLPVPPEFRQQGGIKLVHFWRPDCACNAFNLDHLQTILADYTRDDVALYVAARGASAKMPIQQPYKTLSENANPELFAAIPSAPGVAIWDNDNQLAYFGPYSVGPVCSARNSLITLVLNTLLAGGQASFTTLAGNGCFCAWQRQNQG